MANQQVSCPKHNDSEQPFYPHRNFYEQNQIWNWQTFQEKQACFSVDNTDLVLTYSIYYVAIFWKPSKIQLLIISLRAFLTLLFLPLLSLVHHFIFTLQRKKLQHTAVCRKSSLPHLCPGFGWDRAHFFLVAGKVLLFQVQNYVDNTLITIHFLSKLIKKIIKSGLMMTGTVPSALMSKAMCPNIQRREQSFCYNFV